MKKAILSLLCAMSLGVALPATAAPAPGGGGMGGRVMAMRELRMEHLFKALDLTQAQRQQVKAIRRKHMQATKSLRESVQARRKEFFALMRSASATKDQAIAKQHEVQQIQQQLMDDMIAAWFETRGVLTPDQLKKLEALKPGDGMQRGTPHGDQP